MKIFNTLQELWDHCSVCPVCPNKQREMIISVGPDAVFTVDSFSKRDSSLFLKCTYKKKNNYYTVEYKLDCQTNLFDVVVTNVQINVPEYQVPSKRVTEAYFYFYVQSKCNECKHSNAYSTDLELDIVDKKISNVELEREYFVFVDGQIEYHITTIYDRDVMLVSNNINHAITELPILNIDFSDQPKMINRLKTLILFS